MCFSTDLGMGNMNQDGYCYHVTENLVSTLGLAHSLHYFIWTLYFPDINGRSAWLARVMPLRDRLR